MYSQRVSAGSFMFLIQWSLAPPSSSTYSRRSSMPPGKALWIMGSDQGSSTVMFMVASRLGGSPGRSYWVAMGAPWRYSATRARS